MSTLMSIYRIAMQYAGCINTLTLYDKNILFSIAFGIRGFEDEENQFERSETCKNAIICARRMLQAVKNIAGIENVCVGISTGREFKSPRDSLNLQLQCRF